MQTADTLLKVKNEMVLLWSPRMEKLPEWQELELDALNAMTQNAALLKLRDTFEYNTLCHLIPLEPMRVKVARQTLLDEYTDDDPRFFPEKRLIPPIVAEYNRSMVAQFAPRASSSR